MSQKITQEDGTEIEVYTAEEMTAARAEVEGQYKPQVEKTTADLEEARKALAERTKEFAGANAAFKKLSDESVAKLTETERVLYENQLQLQTERETNATNAKSTRDNSIAAAIRAKVGSDAKLFERTRAMYDLMGLEDITPEQIATRAAAALGALGQTEPDLLAAAGLTMGGAFQPPTAVDTRTETFADTAEGKALAADLGLELEPPKK